MKATTERPRLLAIDDDPGLRALIRATLGDSYEVEQAIDGHGGIASAAANPPDLILLDITMPGLAGYEVCRMLRGTDATRTVPIIFLSGLSRLEDRLAAYDAGGDDFLAKPFDPAELMDKVEATLRRTSEQRRLLEEKNSAFATAMTALSAAGEIGAILDFLRRSFSCVSYEELADAVIETANGWDLTVTVQVRGAGGEISRNHQGRSSPLEAGVLATLAGCGRIAALGRRLAVNFPHFTVMATDMPVEDPERNGRLSDDLAWLAEAADARVQAMDNEAARRAQQQTLQRLVDKTCGALAEIEKRRQVQKASAVVIMQDMVVEMERSFLDCGLTEEQEERLSTALRGAINKVIDIFDQGLTTEKHLQEITAELADAAGRRPSPP